MQRRSLRTHPAIRKKSEIMPSKYLARSGTKHGVCSWTVYFVTDNRFHGCRRGQRPSKGVHALLRACTMTSLSSVRSEIRSSFPHHCSTGTEDHSEVVMATLPGIRQTHTRRMKSTAALQSGRKQAHLPFVGRLILPLPIPRHHHVNRFSFIVWRGITEPAPHRKKRSSSIGRRCPSSQKSLTSSNS